MHPTKFQWHFSHFLVYRSFTVKASSLLFKRLSIISLKNIPLKWNMLKWIIVYWLPAINLLATYNFHPLLSLIDEREWFSLWCDDFIYLRVKFILALSITENNSLFKAHSVEVKQVALLNNLKTPDTAMQHKSASKVESAILLFFVGINHIEWIGDCITSRYKSCLTTWRKKSTKVHRERANKEI